MRIQAVIGSYRDAPTTLLGLLDENTGVLVIAKQVPYGEEKLAPDMALVSNLDLESRDWRFTDDHIQEAIIRFFTRSAQGTISIPRDLTRIDPTSKIEMDNIDVTGRKYRLSPDIANAQIAVLAMVAYADKYSGISAALTAADEMLDIFKAFSV